MLIKESKLRAVIRRIIKESSQETLGANINPVDKIKEIIKNWIRNEVSGVEKFHYGKDSPACNLIFQIIETYSELKSNGEPQDEEWDDDFDYWVDDIMSFLGFYGDLVPDKSTVKGWCLSFPDMSESDINGCTAAVWKVIKESPYVEKALMRMSQEIGQESLKSADDKSNIEQKILDALTKDMSEEEVNRMKANIGELIKIVVESFKDDLERGISFEEAYKDAKDYLESFYKFD